MKPYQRNLLLFYVGTVLFGSVVHTLFDTPYSVFANKRNPLNIYFAKLGWFWTSLTLVPFLAFLSPETHRPRALLRYACATLYWIVFSQWAFGHSVFDRVLISSGTCSIDGLGHPVNCKTGGGEWMGFDVSGHCFILIHMSLFIYEELQLLSHPHPNSRHPTTTAILSSALIFLLLLWYSLLLATSVYFHTWQEKIVGVCVGITYWLLSYVVIWPKWKGGRMLPLKG
ncbi:Fat storage-inducing transmembrane protein [Phlyctochytrium arcticum]|nr:Fat storage-inducing transmembrane protein [Phlyctochytrium arcticum]